jgi:hypothetical protein
MKTKKQTARISLQLMGALAALLMTSGVQASVLITVIQSGGNVVFSSAGGTLDMTGLAVSLDNFCCLGGFSQPTSPEVYIGTNQALDDYNGATGPGSISGVFNPKTADANTGVDVYGGGGNSIVVPDDYVSGALLSAASSTYLGESFASMNLNPGIYVWTLPSSDTLTVNIVPIPAAVWLFGSALGLLGWTRRKSLA